MFALARRLDAYREHKALNPQYDGLIVSTTMPQQINLCTPILLTQKRYFSAQTMVQAVSVFVVLGGSLCAYWVGSLNAASEGYSKALATQSTELGSLRAAVAQSQANARPADASSTRELQERRAELARRERVLEEFQRGLVRPGWGHSARLWLVAQSIPQQVWVTEVRTDESRLDVSGFTLEPAALNEWVAKLAASPLFAGQRLSTVKVANASVVTSEVGTARAPPKWSFTLVSTTVNPTAAGGSVP